MRSERSRICRSATGKPDVQQAKIERLRQVIIGPGFQGPLQILRVAPRRHEQDEHFIAALAAPDIAAQIDAALSGQHPVENEKIEARRGLRGQSFLGFFRTTYRRHFVTTTLDQPLQIATAVGVIFDEQNLHFPGESGEAMMMNSAPIIQQ